MPVLEQLQAIRDLVEGGRSLAIEKEAPTVLNGDVLTQDLLDQ
ncbi:MAG: hypothetical protein ABSC56_08115 [Solirubrobacteraceae bacterium]|jgi:hypothetical protein